MSAIARLLIGPARAALPLAILGVCSLAPVVAWAWATTPITGQVARGKMAVMKRFFLFEPSACHGLAAPPWRVDPKPRFGTVSEVQGAMKLPDGPCPNKDMPYLELRYTAGNEAGVDKFTLSVHDGETFTPMPVTVTVR